MAINITEKNFGKLIDLFNGKNNLHRKKIRILHNLSFIDDPTRILRAIRFEKRYNFRIELKTLKLLKEARRLKMLDKVQPQRLRDELILMLKEKHPLKEIRRIQELVGFSFIDTGLNVTKNTYKLLSSIESQINWFQSVYSQRRQLATWLIYFMGLIDSLSMADVKSICKKFVFRKGEEKIITTYKKIDTVFMRQLSKDKIRPSRIFSLLEPLSYEATLLIKAKSKNHNIKRHIEDFFKIYNNIRLHISGEDLRRLGIAPGPNYQKIFTKVLNAKLNGRVKTKEEELALISKLK
jgi:tRNA nucleotidyltransferase (CCA-adding enzyme)